MTRGSVNTHVVLQQQSREANKHPHESHPASCTDHALTEHSIYFPHKELAIKSRSLVYRATDKIKYTADRERSEREGN